MMFKEKFKLLYEKHLKKSLSPQEKDQFKYVVERNEQEDLLKWTAELATEHFKKAKLDEKKGGWFFSSTQAILTEEENQKIMHILDENFKEEQNKEVRRAFLLKLDFVLKQGKFSFMMERNKNQMEGFSFDYSDLAVSVSSIEEKVLVEASQLGFEIKMENVIKQSSSETAVTFKGDTSEKYVWKASYTLNKPTDPVNSVLHLEMNRINMLYNQAFTERVVSFFSTKVEDNLVEEAYSNWEYIKEKTKKQVNSALTRRNELNLKINPQKIYLPVNRNDYEKGKIVVFDLGLIEISTKDTTNFSLNLSNFNLKLAETLEVKEYEQIVEDISMRVGLALKEDSPIEVKTSFENIALNVDDYSFHLLQNIQQLLSPAATSDCWAVINRNKEEIKKNAVVVGKVHKSAESSQIPEECFAVLSGGYIYFYTNTREDTFYEYFYLKNAVVESEDEFILNIKASTAITLQFSSKVKAKQWSLALSNRIEEMKETIADYELDSIKSEVEQANSHVCHLELDIKGITIRYFQNKKLFSLYSTELIVEVNAYTYETYVNLSLNSLEGDHYIKDTFTRFLSTEDSANIINVSVALLDQKSAKYDDTPMLVAVKIGAAQLHFDPEVINVVVDKLAFNKAASARVLEEIACFSKEELETDSCSQTEESLVDLNLCLMKVNLELNGICLVLVEPRQGITFAKVNMNKSTVEVEMRSRMMEAKGVLGDLTLSDLTNYPYTAVNQAEIKTENKIIYFDSTSSISFKTTMFQPDCALFEGKDMLVEAEVSSVKLFLYQEYILRVINYILADLLPSIPSDSPPAERESFMDIKVKCKNPTIVLKPRKHYEEGFNLDLGEVNITNTYLKAKNRDNADPERELNVVEYIINCKDTNLARFSGFKLLEDSNLEIHVEMLQLPPKEQGRTIREVDKSMYVFIQANGVTMNLRQTDYLLLQHCSFLNLTYTDNMNGVYGIKPPEITAKEEISTMCCEIKIEDITLNMLSEDSLIVSFTQKLFELEFEAFSNLSSKIKISILENMAKSGSSKLPLLYSRSGASNRICIDVLMERSGGKEVSILLENGRCIPCLETVKKLLGFILEGTPDYKNAPDKPNQYNPDPEEAPRMEIVFLLKNSLLCIKTEDSVEDQELLCLGGDMHLTYTVEKIIQLKKHLLSLAEQGLSPVAEYMAVKLHLTDYTFFISTLTALDKNLLPETRILKNTSLVFSYKNNLEKNPDFAYSADISLQHTSVGITLSYKDLILFLKSYNTNLPAPQEQDKLIEEKAREAYNNTSVEVNQKMHIAFNLASLSFVLIDNQQQTFFPFLNVSFKDPTINISYNPTGGLAIMTEFDVKIKNFNYTACCWESMLEQSIVEVGFDSDFTKAALNVDLKARKSDSVYLNLSDMAIIQIGSIFSGWKEKISKLNSNYQEEAAKLIGEGLVSTMSNHKIVNSSHISLVLNQGNSRQLSNNFKPGEIFHLPFDQKNESLYDNQAVDNNRSLFVALVENAELSNPLVRVDRLGSELHSFRQNNSDHCLFRKTTEVGFKKKIEFFSQLTFRNETSEPAVLITEQDHYSLLPGDKVGLSKDYFHQSIKIKWHGRECAVTPRQLGEAQIIHLDDTLLKICCKTKEFKENNTTFVSKSFVLLPPLTIRNCLPHQMTMIYGNNSTVQFGKNEAVDLYDYSEDSSMLTFRIKFDEFLSEPVKIKFTTVSSAEIKCENNMISLTILIKRIFKEGRVVLVFYPCGMLINETNLPFLFLYKKNETAGFGEITMLSNKKKVYCKLDGEISQPFNINAVGFSSSIFIKNREYSSEFVLQSNLELIASDLNIYVNIFRLSPKYVLCNYLNKSFLFTNEKTKESHVVQSNERKVLEHFSIDTRFGFKLIEDNLEISQSKWSLSVNNTVEFKKMYTVSVSDGINEAFINIEKKIFNNTIFIIISEASTEKCEYLVRNNVEGIPIDIGNYTVLPGSSQIVVKTKEILSFIFGDIPRRIKVDADCIQVENSQTQKLPYREQLIALDKGFILSVYNDGNKIVIETSESQQKPSLLKEIQIILKHQNLGISLVGNLSQDKFLRKEIIFVSFYQSVVFMSVKQYSDKLFVACQLQTKGIQVDNALENISFFPVMMYPVHEEKPFFNLNLSLEIENNSNVVKLKEFNYLLQAFKVKVNTTLLDGILRFADNITSAFDTTVTAVNPAFLVDGKHYFDWISRSFKGDSTELFMELVELSPLEIEVFFRNDSKSGFIQDKIASNPVIYSLINTFSTIDGAPIFLGGKSLTNVYGNLDEVTFALAGEYKDNFSKQFYKIVGSIEILGNPVGLASNLGRGIKEFYEKPIKGIVKGPVQGITGLFEGSASLIKNTMAGTFGAASSVGSGISKGLLTLTMDKEYMHAKEMNKVNKRPKNFGEGIAFGLESAAKGVFSGVSDIFMKPIKGAKKDNVAGFGKGVVQGISGAIFKPVSGVFDLFSKTTEGFKNTISEDKMEEKKRVGLILYGRDKVIKRFDDNMSKVKKIVEKEFFDNKEVDFETAKRYVGSNNINYLLVFLVDRMLLIDIDNNFEISVTMQRSWAERADLVSPRKLTIFTNRPFESGKKQASIYFAEKENQGNIERIATTLTKWIEDTEIFI